MEELYACVRFTDELKKNQFVSIKEIKVDKSDTHHIRPATVDDFDPQRQYDILWCLCDTIDCTDINNKSCEYHKGYIVCLAETLADAEEKGNSTRFRLPRKIFSPSDPKLPSNSQTILQKNCSQSTVSGLHNFNEKLVVKLDNLNHAKAIEKAKLRASKEQLGAYAKNQFTGGRKSFLSFSQNDHDNGRSNEDEHNVNGP
ncbi:uncharacterized protein LOC116418011 [Nasonia vitripennis]|uniref:Uncharacterized protein n=1 Tax=Nasonia vitripennis TaxID=7425 RepID=A0A7M7QKE5_NASVI|nr:uncharacterized protein LOC116418011 [Nasonia vitripennis]